MCLDFKLVPPSLFHISFSILVFRYLQIGFSVAIFDPSFESVSLIMVDTSEGGSKRFPLCRRDRKVTITRKVSISTTDRTRDKLEHIEPIQLDSKC